MEKRMNVTTLTITMAAYPNRRVAAIVISVLYRRLTQIGAQNLIVRHPTIHQLLELLYNQPDC